MNACTIVMSDPADALRTSPLGQLRRLVVTADDAQVIITGRVKTFYCKQMAQETVRPFLGDRTLLNHVEVSSDPA